MLSRGKWQRGVQLIIGGATSLHAYFPRRPKGTGSSSTKVVGSPFRRLPSPLGPSTLCKTGCCLERIFVRFQQLRSFSQPRCTNHQFLEQLIDNFRIIVRLSPSAVMKEESLASILTSDFLRIRVDLSIRFTLAFQAVGVSEYDRSWPAKFRGGFSPWLGHGGRDYERP